MTVVYHEANPSSLNTILRDGLHCTSRGDKGDDKAIIKTDKFLDDYLPRYLRHTGISRDNNLYAYAATNHKIIDITNGKSVGIERFVNNSQQIVLLLRVDPHRCFVSDLDLFDNLKNALLENTSPTQLKQHAALYWRALVPLDKFQFGDIKRPEIMVPYDIAITDIKVLNKG
jgi:hypothetical protein